MTTDIVIDSLAARQTNEQANEQAEESPSLRRRHARHRFSLAFIALASMLAWLLTGYLTPDMSRADLSAKPAPSPPRILPALTNLPPMQRRSTTYTLAAGDSLAALLARQNINAVAADAALDELRRVFDSRKLKAGQKIRLYQEWPSNQNPAQHPGRFAGFDFIPVAHQKLVVRRVAHLQFIAERQKRILSARHFMADTLITSSVYEAARGSGIAPNLVVELIRLFSFSIDFQRDIREGDQLEVLYTRRFDEANQLAEEGDVIFTALTNRGKRHAYWRLQHDDGSFAYYDENGKSVQRLLMKTPVDGARLSSRFGMRRHPILGYTRLHRGLDFAAPIGTPIFAAGDGVITRIGSYGNYGKYIRIRHRNGYETAYAHLSRYARGLRRGSRVRQGDVIGRVGRTGLATGPHLHYEVLHRKKPINPRTLTLPPGRILDANGVNKLTELRAAADKRILSLAASQNTLASLPRLKSGQ